MDYKNEFLEESLPVEKDIIKQSEFGHNLAVIIFVIEIMAFAICFWIGTIGNSSY